MTLDLKTDVSHMGHLPPRPAPPKRPLTARPVPRDPWADRDDQPASRCQSAHPNDPTSCEGPQDAVTVLDAYNHGATGCEHHAARLLASLEGGRVYANPEAPSGAAIRVFNAAAELPPFAWVERGRS
jgi:hypothetical protein